MSKAELERMHAAFKRKAKEMMEEHLQKLTRFEKEHTENSSAVDEILVAEVPPESLLLNNVEGSICDFKNSNLTLSEKLSKWKALHIISEEAMNDLYEILKSFGYSLESKSAPKPDTLPNSDPDPLQHITAESYISDTNSIIERVKTEFAEDSYNSYQPPQPPNNEVSLSAIMSKLNDLTSVVNETNADVQDIKRSLNRLECSAPKLEFNHFLEDYANLIPGIDLPVKTREELYRLEEYLSNTENSKRVAHRIKFETVDLKRSLYCNFSSIAEKMVCTSLAGEYSLCGQRGKLRFLDFKALVSFMKYTCRIGYECRNHVFTYSEIEQDKAIGSFLRYIKSRTASD